MNNNTDNNTDNATDNNPPDPTWDTIPSRPPATATAAKTLNAISETLSGFVGKLVALATRALTPEHIGRVTAGARLVGNYAVLAGIAFALIHAIIAAVRHKSLLVFVIGVCVALAIVVAHYAAGRFMDSSDKIIAGTPGRVSSKAFLECAGLFLLLGAIGMFAGGIYTSIRLSSAVPLISAIVIAPLLALAATIALNPGSVGIETGEAVSAGEEAIGLLSFCLKIWLKLVPALFCLLALAGCVVTVWGYFNQNVGSAGISGISSPVPLPFISQFMVSGMAGPSLVLYACVTPIIVYLSFIFWNLGLDLARAILSIPGKLDSLRR